MFKLNRLVLTILLTIPSFSGLAGEVEMLHWWTSSGEKKSVDVLRNMMVQQGHHWKNFAIPGGGGSSAMTVLKMRALSGNPPTAAQLKGNAIQEWGKLGFLTQLDAVAKKESWDQVLPPTVADSMKYEGHYVAVPVNVHRVNWLWVNPEVFNVTGTKLPTTLEEFFIAADKIKAAGYIALAHGGKPWQDTTLFEIVALAVLGSENYRNAFVNLDLSVLHSESMIEVFRQFKRMRNYIDGDSPHREWSSATEMVIEGKAAMQFMGDWAKGEFTESDKQPGKDYLCIAAPGTQQQFIYNIDSIAFFKLQGSEEDDLAQLDLARTILTTPFQRAFNLNKGSIPVRLDMDVSDFDQCALDSMQAFKSAASSNNLLPSISHHLATTRDVQSAIVDVVSNFFNQANSDPEIAAERLAQVVRSAK